MRLYFSGLNGLRAIAALAVVFAHTTKGLNEFGLNCYIFGKTAGGSAVTTTLASFGVSIFFTLSGFLITYLLLKEKEVAEINIKNFYIRRILRIWPLYYLYLIIAIITAYVFNISYEATSILFYIFLLANVPFIIGGFFPFTAHYWSLGVEEQFYSFWPWLVKKSTNLLKTTVIVCFALITLKVILRLIDIKTNNGDPGLFYNIIHVTRFHCMLIGAIGSILYYKNNVTFLKLTNNFIAQFISWLVIFLSTINQFHISSIIDNELISFVTVFLIISQTEKSKRLINLNTSFFDFIGKISYGIYMIHPLIIFYLSKVLVFSNDDSIYNYIIVYCAVFSITIFVAYISYSYFEKYFLDMKDKYSAVKSTVTMPSKD